MITTKNSGGKDWSKALSFKGVSYSSLFFLLLLFFSSFGSALFIGSSNSGTVLRYNNTYYINGSNINASSKVCSSLGANYFLQDYNNVTGVYTCSESTGSGVSITTIQNYFANGTNLNKTYADTLYAPIGAGSDNASWNQTYANTLYYSINNPSGYITNTVNSSYYLISNPYGYYNSSTIPSFMLTSTAQNYFFNGTNVNASSLSGNLSNYYLASNPSNYITDGNTNWDNIYGYSTVNASSKTCGAGQFVSAYNNLTGELTCSTPAASSQGVNLTTTTCTTGQFVSAVNNLTGVVTCSTPSVVNTSYYLASNPSGYITDGNTNWDNSYGFTTTNITTTTCSAGQVVTAINNLTGIVTCSSMPTVNTSYALQSDLLSYNRNGTHINQSFADSRYLQSYTESDPHWTGNRSSYSTTAVANTLYKAIGVETYNSTNFIAGQNYVYRAGNTTCGLGDVLNGFNNTTGTFNCIATPSGTESDPHWTGNITNYYTKTLINDYFANGTNVNASSLASNLSGYLTQSAANGLYKSLGVETWNSTYSGFNKTYADTLYYSSTNPSNYITDGNTNWDNSYGFTTVNASSITCPAGDFVSAYSNLTGVLTCSTPSVAGDNTSWSENRVRQLLNSTQFDVNSEQNFTIKESWLNTIYAKITDYFTKTVIQNYFSNGTNVNASSLASNLSLYSTTTVANTLYKAIGIETWNSTANGFNQTYANTLYKALGVQTWNDTQATFNKTYADTLYYPKSSNTLAYWNVTSNGFNETYANTKYKALSVETWNSTYSPVNLTSNQTFTGNLTVEGIAFEDDTNHRLLSNASCIYFISDTSRLEIC